ncbi:MAG: hypothetical protein M1840_006080 [Geoglossum simile]|nr:MAG: hypothetical protein M1840_006080 [Geoglossum simile]
MAETAVIDNAFSDQPALKRAIADAVTQTPQHAQLFYSIAQYVSKLKSGDSEDVPAAKRRRIDGLAVRHQDNSENVRPEQIEIGPMVKGIPGVSDGQVLLLVADISFSVPQRKKLVLEFFEWGLRATSLQTGSAEFGVRYKDIRMFFARLRYKPLKMAVVRPLGLALRIYVSRTASLTVAFVVLEHVSCVPVPEKTQRQYNFCIFPPGTNGFSEGSNSTDNNAIVFTIPDGPPKTASGPEFEGGDGATYKTLLVGFMNKRLPPEGKVEEPSEKLFASSIVQNHRKGEKAVHVKAFRGSKDGQLYLWQRPTPTQLYLATTLTYFQLGYLFFLPTGILWAFKKPLLFFAFDVIDSTSYTSVLQRTFNLNIATRASDNTQEFEFSMIDQADFSGIDAYIRGHGLQDASMAEQRRAKKLNVNGASVGKYGVGEAKERDEGEIAKAVREMEDEEDEEEEDYNPGSEGDSEGSGTDSEEEDGQEGGSDDEEKDLIEEELGSEAEDVDDAE